MNGETLRQQVADRFDDFNEQDKQSGEMALDALLAAKAISDEQHRAAVVEFRARISEQAKRSFG